MIVRIGIDLVEVDRIAHAMENPRFRGRVLTESEDAYCRTVTSVAGRWAAKEALYKAVGSDLGWQDIEILNDVRGEPIPNILKPGVMDGNHRLHLSISHERGIAMATAIYERVS